MRVISKLAQIDFQFGRIARQENLLVIESHPDSKMPSTVYVSPEDVLNALKRMLVSPGALFFVLGLPYFLYRWRTNESAEVAGQKARKPWPKV